MGTYTYSPTYEFGPISFDVLVSDIIGQYLALPLKVIDITFFYSTIRVKKDEQITDNLKPINIPTSTQKRHTELFLFVIFISGQSHPSLILRVPASWSIAILQ